MTAETTDQQDTTNATTTTTWMKFARATAIGIVIWAIILHITARVLVPPVLVIGLIYLVFAPFLTGERRKLGIAYAAVSLLAILGNIPGLVDELSHPESAPAFILTLLSTTLALLAVVAGLGAFFRWPVAPMRPLAVAATAVFAVGALASVVIAANTESDAALATDAEVLAEKVEFLPEQVVLTADSSGVWVDNKDGIRHTFTVEELGVDLEVPALKSRRVDIDAAPGTYDVICDVPGHENMTATLVVEG